MARRVEEGRDAREMPRAGQKRGLEPKDASTEGSGQSGLERDRATGLRQHQTNTDRTTDDRPRGERR